MSPSRLETIPLSSGFSYVHLIDAAPKQHHPGAENISENLFRAYQGDPDASVAGEERDFSCDAFAVESVPLECRISQSAEGWAVAGGEAAFAEALRWMRRRWSFAWRSTGGV
jgi:hypothetical protein